MAETVVQGPNGQTFKVTHPEGATRAEIIAYAKVKAPLAARLSENAIPEQHIPAPDRSLLGTAKGVGEAALALGTAMPIETARGAGSGIEMLIDAALGKSDPNATRDKWQGMFRGGYEPSTQEGQRYIAGASYPFRKLDEGATHVAEGVVDNAQGARMFPRTTGAIAAGIKTLPEALMTVGGLKGMRNPATRAADVRRVNEAAERLGLDMSQPTATQAEALATHAEGMTSGAGRYEGLDTLPAVLRRERNAESRRIGGVFDEAEGMGAQIPSRTTGGLSDKLNDIASRYAYTSMPSVVKLLDEAKQFTMPSQTSISEVLGVRNSAKVPVNRIFEFRAKINDNLPSDYRSPEYSALSQMKREVDNYLNETLAADLVTGNPQAITKWQEAIGQWHDFRNTFDENAVVRKLQEDGATGEQVHNLIFGMGKLRAPRQAANVVTNLEKILGRDSPEFQAIQSGLMTRLVEPLVDAEPNLPKFANEYDAFKRNNPSLMKALFDEDQLAALDETADFSRAVDKTMPLGEAQMGKIKLVWQNLIARFGVGHGIAQGAARVSIVTKLLEMFTPNMGISRKRAMMREMLGYDPTKSIFQNANPVATTGTYQVLSDQENTLPEILRR